MSKEPRILKCDENTQFAIERRDAGHSKIWSGGPEICIAHILKGKRSQYGPSIPLDKIPDLIVFLAQTYGDMKDEIARQGSNPVTQ